jgi:hypothetical protein
MPPIPLGTETTEPCGPLLRRAGVDRTSRGESDERHTIGARASGLYRRLPSDVSARLRKRRRLFYVGLWLRRFVRLWRLLWLRRCVWRFVWLRVRRRSVALCSGNCRLPDLSHRLRQLLHVRARRRLLWHLRIEFGLCVRDRWLRLRRVSVRLLALWSRCLWQLRPRLLQFGRPILQLQSRSAGRPNGLPVLHDPRPARFPAIQSATVGTVLRGGPSTAWRRPPGRMPSELTRIPRHSAWPPTLTQAA